MSDQLKQTIKDMVVVGKGILAADESVKTATKRLASINVESTEETRRQYRNLMLAAPGIEKYICGVIMFEETLHQKSDDGTPFPKLLAKKGIVPGIKVDEGLADLDNGEQCTKGLDTLGRRLEEYKKFGTRFAKWRAVYSISENTPTDPIVKRNAEDLAKYASISQNHGFVPIVEPEVLMDGNHSIERCGEVTLKALESVFAQLQKYRVVLSGMLLKPNMVIQAKENMTKASSKEIAEATLRCFSDVIPETLPGIVFLSGGQAPEEATNNLNEMNNIGFFTELSFSFGRALQEPVLKAWAGKSENLKLAQDAFIKRAKMNSLAREGKYAVDME